MKKLIAFLLLLHSVAFAQTPDTLTPEKKARWKIGRIRDNTIRAITPLDFRNAFNAVTNLAVSRVPFVTASELRAGKADTAGIVQVLRGNKIFLYRYDAGSTAADDSATVIRNGSRRYVAVADYVTPELFGAIGDGVANDTRAVQKAVNFLATRTRSRLLRLENTYKCDSVIISLDNVYVSGSGTLLDAKFVIGSNSIPRATNINVEGITLAKTTLGAGKNGIEYRYIARSMVQNVNFQNCDKSIYSAPIDYFQHANRITITGGNWTNCNYVLYCDKAAGGAQLLPTGDIHIVNCLQLQANITTVWAKGLDGLEFVGNTVFFIGSAAKNNVKNNHIYIDEGRFITISSNNLFEPGLESVLLNNCIRVNVSNNNIAWPGQRVPSSAIKITYTDVQTGNNWVQISKNNIDSPTLHGIEVGVNCYGGNVTENLISSVGNTDHYYGTDYGQVALSSLTHYLISMDASVKYYQVLNNNAGFNNLLPASYNFPNVTNQRTNRIRGNWDTTLDEKSVSRELAVATTTTSITVTGSDQVNLQQPSPTTVTVIGGGGMQLRTITFIGFNANTTFQHNAQIALKGGVDATVPLDGVLVLQWNYTKWREVSRNW